MGSMIPKPDGCVAVDTEAEYAVFGRVLAQYDRYTGFSMADVESPRLVRAYYAADTAGRPFAAAMLHQHDSHNRTVALCCITNDEGQTDRMVSMIEWITGIAILELGIDKVYTLVAEDSQEYSALFLAAGYSYDGFLRDHLLLPGGRRSDAYLISILKHEYERQHCLHCMLSKSGS